MNKNPPIKQTAIFVYCTVVSQRSNTTPYIAKQIEPKILDQDFESHIFSDDLSVLIHNTFKFGFLDFPG